MTPRGLSGLTAAMLTMVAEGLSAPEMSREMGRSMGLAPTMPEQIAEDVTRRKFKNRSMLQGQCPGCKGTPGRGPCMRRSCPLFNKPRQS